MSSVFLFEEEEENPGKMYLQKYELFQAVGVSVFMNSQVSSYFFYFVSPGLFQSPAITIKEFMTFSFGNNSAEESIKSPSWNF